MDLKEFYFQNIKEDEYHHRFYDSIKNSNVIYDIFAGYVEVGYISYDVYDVEEAIVKFRELCQPPDRRRAVLPGRGAKQPHRARARRYGEVLRWASEEP